MILRSNIVLQLLLSGAVTTNELVFAGSYRDTLVETADKVRSTIHENYFTGQSNGVTPVTMLAAPPEANIERRVEELTISNLDTVAATITVRLFIDPNTFLKQKIALDPGDTVCYGNDFRWYVLDSTGAVKGAGGSDIGDSPLFTNLTLSGYQDFREIAPPSNPSANTLRLYVTDEGGFPVIHHLDPNGLDYELSRDSVTVVRNNSGVTISKGAAVYITGATGNFPIVDKSQADSLSKLPVAGIVVADIANNSFGQIVTIGDVVIDTQAFTDGQVLYVSETIAGALTAVRPSAPDFPHRVGVVIKGGSPNGIVQVLIGDVSRFLERNDNLFDLTDAAAARTNLGVAIGSDVQSWDADLDSIATLPSADGNFIVGSVAGWVAESGATARASMGVSIGSDVQAHGDVLDNFNTLGAASADGEFIVATGAGAFAYESGDTLVTSIGASACAFLAYNSANDTNQTGNGAEATVEFDTEIHDRGSDFNNTTDTFTAPVTGLYDLAAAVHMVALSSATRIFVRIVTSNRTYQWFRNINSDVNQGLFIAVQGADMDAADTATVTVTVEGMAGNTATINGAVGQMTTWFGGRLAA